MKRNKKSKKEKKLIGGSENHEQEMFKKKKKEICYAQMRKIKQGAEHKHNYRQISNVSYVNCTPPQQRN